MEISKSFYCAIKIMVVICSSAGYSISQEQNLRADISQLSSALPGCYSNAKQYYTYAMSRAAPRHKRQNLFLLRVEFYKLESPLFNDSLTIYFQDFTKSSKVPFSSGFYSFSPDYDTDAIRMKVYTFKTAVPDLKISISNYSIGEGSKEAKMLTAAFHRAKLNTHASCDMLWKKTGVRIFTGVTHSACVANLGKESVRISVSMTLTSSRITMTEGWYNMDESARLRELRIPYVLKRKSVHPIGHVDKPRMKSFSDRKNKNNAADTENPDRTSHKLKMSLKALRAEEIKNAYRKNMHSSKRTNSSHTKYASNMSLKVKGKRKPGNLYVLKRKNIQRILKTSKSDTSKTKSLVNNSNKSRFILGSKQKKGIRENLSTYHKLKTLANKQFYAKTRSLTTTRKSTKFQNNETKRRKRAGHLRRRRTLRTFRQVRESLLTGKAVFYKVDLSNCIMPAQVPVNRLSFGGEIKKFLIIREQLTAKRETKIHFTTSRTSISSKGVELMQRDFTLYRGGRVEVKVTKRFRDPRKLERKYTFQCKLFTNKKARGGVKLSTFHSTRPKEAQILSKITRSLGQGRDLWLTADVSKCRGSRDEKTVMVGGTVSNYDLVNNAKTLELFLPVEQIEPGSRQISHTSGFVIQIFKNGDAILTWINASNEELDSKRKFDDSSAYQCAISNRLASMTNQAGTGNVNVFIR